MSVEIHPATIDNTSTIDHIDKEVVEVEHHLHNFEKWFGIAAPQVGENTIAERVIGDTAVFALVSGTSAFNATWTQILGATDTPVASGKTKFDLHRFLVTTTDSTNPFIIQIVSGESAGIAAKISAEDFTEFMYIASTNNSDSGISDIIDKRVDAGTKLWARCACIGATGKTINFYFGLHEYDV